jgi:transcriptional regulator GlxA family with amidase domain
MPLINEERQSVLGLHRVVALVLETVVPFDLAVACQVFGWGRPDLGEVRYAFALCGEKPGLVRASQGFGIEVSRGLGALRRADTIVVPGTSDLSLAVSPAVSGALRREYERGARVLSICSGAFVLAEAGLLNGRRATTHWQDAALFAQRYPAVTVDPSVLFVDEGRVLTSAGIAAGIDLCLHVVLADHGAAVAKAIARRLVVPQYRGGGQAQYIETPVPEPQGSTLERTREYMVRHIAETLSIATMARHARMSERNFARRFVEESGISPVQWLLRQRVLLARELLERTDLSVKQIAARTGSWSPMSLREHFKRQVGTTPALYRLGFRRPTKAQYDGHAPVHK